MFQSLPGASFIVNGVVPAQNSALTSAGAELRLANGVTLLAKFDGEFASHSSTYGGTGPSAIGGSVLGEPWLDGLKVRCGSKCEELEPSTSDGH